VCDIDACKVGVDSYCSNKKSVFTTFNDTYKINDKDGWVTKWFEPRPANQQWHWWTNCWCFITFWMVGNIVCFVFIWGIHELMSKSVKPYKGPPADAVRAKRRSIKRM
jgi:hypothetical protein